MRNGTYTKLPHEIVLYIIENQLHGERISIKHLSLACSALRYACQRILFRTLKLRNPSYSVKSFALGQKLDFFQESPHIAQSYREVVILDKPLSASAQRLWLHSDPVLADALRCLSIDEIVSFTFDRLRGRPFEDTLSPSMQSVIVAICQSPSLKSLHLKCAPLSLLRFCGPSLQHLEIKAAALEEIPGHSLDTIVQLQSVEVASSDTLKEEVAALLKLSNLCVRGLTGIRASLEKLPEDYLQIMPLIGVSCLSLKSLSIAHMGSTPTLPGCYDMSAMSAVQKIGISWNSSDVYHLEDANQVTYASQMLIWITDSLVTLPLGNAVQTISLYILTLSMAEIGRQGSLWSHLDLALSNIDHFPHLKLMRIVLGYHSQSYSAEAKRIADTLRQDLPTLARSGQLEVDHIVYSRTMTYAQI
ncbi:hypothetical protein BKA70DRAFT_725351 [Coprinopsis sp. MPI-PUGE-AT-0042]|nr:hypothetical protein BKA70DRAFT_725351 [Coprinopsis sp. MPI-PUGE-AT-0042]